MEEVLQEVRHEINRKFEDINQDYKENIKRYYEEYIKKTMSQKYKYLRMIIIIMMTCWMITCWTSEVMGNSQNIR
jgi:ribosome-binding ATPase YchF (GTP1/OBG family)